MDEHIRPDFTSIALIMIDIQRDTLDGEPFEVLGTSAILPRMKRFVR